MPDRPVTPEQTIQRLPREIEELVWIARSPDCTVPNRCGQHGWRNCDTCEAFQERLNDSILARLDGERPGD